MRTRRARSPLTASLLPRAQPVAQVAARRGARNLDPPEGLSAPRLRQRVHVLREHSAVPLRQPAEQIVGYPRIVRAVLAVAAVGRRERERPVRRGVLGECVLAPRDVRPSALLPAAEVLSLLLVGVVGPEVLRAG